jgi:hypothetical protein
MVQSCKNGQKPSLKHERNVHTETEDQISGREDRGVVLFQKEKLTREEALESQLRNVEMHAS